MWSLFPLSHNIFTLLLLLTAGGIIFLEVREIDKFYNAKVKPFKPKKISTDQPTNNNGKEDSKSNINNPEQTTSETSTASETTEVISDVVSENIIDANVDMKDSKPEEPVENDQVLDTIDQVPDIESTYSITSTITSAKHVPFPNTIKPPMLTKEEIEAICARIIFPFMTGCEPFGDNADYLATKYPTLSRPDIVRYLVARKGNVKASEEMLLASMKWFDTHFPLSQTAVQTALNSQCFFPYGRAKDGTPIVYMRGGLYDANTASPQQYVLAAAYTIDYALRQCPDQVNVTVIVCTDHVPNGPNQSADTNFIKLFCQVLSDNYPERLKRLAMFPFPWYGRAIWAVVRVFVDKRTQDKVMLLSSKSDATNPIPLELQDILDLDQVPICLGGKCNTPIVNLLETLPE